jgi:hypothetical protein
MFQMSFVFSVWPVNQLDDTLEQVPALPVTHRPANLQVRWSCKSLGHATIQFATVPVLCIFVRKKEEKESQEGKEERQNQEEQKSILAGH